MRDNGEEINLPSLNVNYKIIDNTYPDLDIEFAVIDQVWNYYAMDTTLINSNEVIPEYVYDPNEFNYLEVPVQKKGNTFTFDHAIMLGGTVAFSFKGEAIPSTVTSI